MKEFSKSLDPTIVGQPPEVTYHPPTGISTENVKLPDQAKEAKVFTLQDVFSHINAIENELKTELNEIKKVLNKLVKERLDK